MLDVSNDATALTLFDEKGEIRTMLEANKDGPSLGLADENGKIRVALVVGEGKGHAGLCVFDENEKVVQSVP
jgi:hypothetical protein